MGSQERQSLAPAAVDAIRSGDIDALKQALETDRDLVRTTIDGQRTLLHVATDWPGHFPNNSASVTELILSGADVNATFIGRHSETPLHWAASTDDVAVLDILLDHGADIEARGGVVGGGTPLADAVAFGQWRAARRLVERGARTMLWEAAALGLMSRVTEFFVGVATPAQDDVTNAFWCACDGGQRETAEFLLAHGADLNWLGHDGLTPLDAASRSGAEGLVHWLRQQGAVSNPKCDE